MKFFSVKNLLMNCSLNEKFTVVFESFDGKVNQGYLEHRDC